MEAPAEKPKRIRKPKAVVAAPELTPTVSAPAMTEELATEFVADQNAEAQGLVPVGISINRKFKRTQAAKARKVKARSVGTSRQIKLAGGRVVDRREPISEVLPDGYRILHPTKGWRTITQRRLARIEALPKLRELWGNFFGPPERSMARDIKRVTPERDLPPDTMTRQRRRWAARHPEAA